MFGTFSWPHLSSAPDRLSCGGRECLEGGEGRGEGRGEERRGERERNKERGKSGRKGKEEREGGWRERRLAQGIG